MNSRAASSVLVLPWRDEVVDASGFPPLSRYVETVWLPVAGPSATWAYRRLGILALAVPEGVALDLVVLGQDLGLSANGVVSSRLVHALDRLERFGLLARFDTEIWVRTSAPPVPDRLVGRLSPAVQAVHRELSSVP